MSSRLEGIGIGFMIGLLIGAFVMMLASPQLHPDAVKRGWAVNGGAVYRIIPAEVK